MSIEYLTFCYFGVISWVTSYWHILKWYLSDHSIRLLKGIGPVFPPDWGRCTSSSKIEVVPQQKVFEIQKNCKLCMYAILEAVSNWLYIGLKWVCFHSNRAEINAHCVLPKVKKHDSWWPYLHFSPLYYPFQSTYMLWKGLKW